MAITLVRVQLDGSWHTLTYNEQTEHYEATIAAPATPNYGKGAYIVTVQAQNDAPCTDTITAELTVRAETIPPTVVVTAPAAHEYVTDARQPITLELRDEVNGSGVDIRSFALVLDDVTLFHDADGMVCTECEHGYDVAYTPPVALRDGAHSLTAVVHDMDGNAAEPAAVGWTADATPPVLTVSHPPDIFNTNKPCLAVTGTAEDATSPPVTVTVNGEHAHIANGKFTHEILLTEGMNTVTVAATDMAGMTTAITRTVLLDTVAPKITFVHIRPRMEDIGETYLVTVDLAPSTSAKAKERVAGTVNETAVVFEEAPALHWAAVVPRHHTDIYTIALVAADAAGNQIAHRVIFPCGMECKWNWTSAEYLNAIDLNRIEYNTEFLRQKLTQYGYYTRITRTKSDWTCYDIPTRPEVDRIRENVDALQIGFYALHAWRVIAYSNTLDHGQLNAIEWNLHTIDVWIERMVEANRYAGTFNAGQQCNF